jgi:transposase-like protein
MQQSAQQTTTRVNRTAEEMYDLIAGYKNSEMTVREYCERNDLAPGIYYYWQKKYHNRNGVSDTSQSGFSLLQMQDSLQQAGLFAEVKGIKLYRAVTASYLKELIS